MTNHPDSPIANAERLVAAAEELELSDPFAAPLKAAEDAVAAARAGALAKLFPTDEIVVFGADAVATFQLYAARFPRNGPAHGHELAKLHRRAVGTAPEVARIARTERAGVIAALRRSEPQAMRPGDQVAIDAARNAEVSKFEATIASDLTDDAELGAAAQAVLAADELAIRIRACRERHEGHARLEVAKFEAERRAVEDARDREIELEMATAARAVDEAARDVKAATMQARRLRGERLGRALQKAAESGLEVIRTQAGEVFDLADLVRTAAAGMSDETMSKIEAALENNLWRHRRTA